MKNCTYSSLGTALGQVIYVYCVLVGPAGLGTADIVPDIEA